MEEGVNFLMKLMGYFFSCRRKKNFHSPSPSLTLRNGQIFQDFSSIFPHFPLCNSGILYYIFSSIHHTKNFYVPWADGAKKEREPFMYNKHKKSHLMIFFHRMCFYFFSGNAGK